MEWNGIVGGPHGGKKLLGPQYKVGARLAISIFTKIDSLAGNIFFLIFSFYKSFLTIFRFFENFKNLFLDFLHFCSYDAVRLVYRRACRRRHHHPEAVSLVECPPPPAATAQCADTDGSCLLLFSPA
jgi:hypothetical protein